MPSATVLPESRPPPEETVPIEEFKKAIGRVESALGLSGQPRAIVFHEKEGRRHAHAVWSRIDSEQIKAASLFYFKNNLKDVPRSLFIEHEWQMPRGLMNSSEKDPANFSLAEWQQAKRQGYAPKVLKGMFLECWAVSDSRASISQASQENGFHHCRGDKRGVQAAARIDGGRTSPLGHGASGDRLFLLERAEGLAPKPHEQSPLRQKRSADARGMEAGWPRQLLVGSIHESPVRPQPGAPTSLPITSLTCR